MDYISFNGKPIGGLTVCGLSRMPLRDTRWWAGRDEAALTELA